MVDRTEIEDFKEKASDFLVKCYELTEGDKSRSVPMDRVGKELGFEPALATAIANHLLQEHLIQLPELGGSISITVKGALRVRAVRS
jgi:hypothetical protein